MLLRIYYCCLVSVLVWAVDLQAQNMTSPYSVYGVGNFDFRSYNRNSGIGHAGLAMKSNTQLIGNNPASIAALDKSFYIADISLAGSAVQYAGDPITLDNRSSRNFGVKRGALSVKITNHWAGSIGFRQLSNVNYKYKGSLSLEGSPEKYPVDYEGDGGLNYFYWTNALSIGKHLQAGITFGVVNGSVNRSEILSDASIGRTIETRVQDYYSSLRLEYGLLYSLPLNKRWQLSVGGRLTTKTTLPVERTLTVLENSVPFVENELIEGEDFQLPLTYGVGIALTRNHSFTIAADYHYENWKPLQIRGNGWSMIDNHRFSGGFEISRLVRVWNRPVERRYFQFGGFADNGNLSMRSNAISGFGVTAGYGGSFERLQYSLAIELGQRGITNDGLIRESYFQFTIGLSYRDFLFTRGKKYD